MAKKKKYPRRIDAIKAYLLSLLEKEEKPKETTTGEKSLAEQINFGGKYDERAEGGVLVGEDTGKTTQAGRTVYKTPEGEMVSEKSTTFKYKGKWINIPSIVMGERLEDEELKELLDEGLIEPTSMHDELEEAEKAAEERSDSLEFNRGGTPMDEQMSMFKEGGLLDEGGEVDEESGNDVPIGGTKEGVRDDIPAMLSEGEFVFPEDVTRYHGLEKLMTLRQEAKMGLKKMEAMGQMGNSEEATIPDDLPFSMDDLLVVVTGEEEAEGKKDDEPIKAQAGTFVAPTQPAGTFTPSGQQLNNMGVMGFQESMYGQQGIQNNNTGVPAPSVPASSVVPTVQTPQVNTGYSAPTVPATPVDQTNFVEDVSDIYKPVKYINPTSGETMTINEYQGNPVSAVPAGFVRYDDYIAGGGKDPSEDDVTTGVESASVETAKVAGAQDDERKAKLSNLNKMKEDKERERVQEYNRVFDTESKSFTDKNDDNYITNEMLIDAYKDQMQAENVGAGLGFLGAGLPGLLPRLGRGKVNKALDARFGTAAGYDNFKDNPEFQKLTEGVTRGSVLKEAGSKIKDDFSKSFGSGFYDSYKSKYDVKAYDDSRGGTGFKKDPVTNQLSGNLNVREQQHFDNAVDSGNDAIANHFSLIAASRAEKDATARASKDLIKKAQKAKAAGDEEAYDRLKEDIKRKNTGSVRLGDSSIDEIINHGSSSLTAVNNGNSSPAKGFKKAEPKRNSGGSSSTSVSTSSGRPKKDVQKEINAKIKAATTYDEFGDKVVDWKKADVGKLVKERDEPSSSSNDSGSGSSPTASSAAGGGCCFIMLEARYGDGTMDEVVRKYRDEHMTERNRRGYYKVAEVFVPLMRKSRMFKWVVTKTFADPLVSYGKYYYGQNKHGVIYSPVKNFWMKVFDTVGSDVEFIRENGETV